MPCLFVRLVGFGGPQEHASARRGTFGQLHPRGGEQLINARLEYTHLTSRVILPDMPSRTKGDDHALQRVALRRCRIQADYAKVVAVRQQQATGADIAQLIYNGDQVGAGSRPGNVRWVRGLARARNVIVNQQRISGRIPLGANGNEVNVSGQDTIHRSKRSEIRPCQHFVAEVRLVNDTVRQRIPEATCRMNVHVGPGIPCAQCCDKCGSARFAVCRLDTRQNVIATLIDIVYPRRLTGVRGKLKTEAWQSQTNRSFLDPGIEVYPMHHGVMGP